MKVTRLEFINCGIIRSLELTCGDASVILLRGQNATGKTTIINAILALLEGGAHPELIGPAANHYLVEMHLDNGMKFLRREWRDESGEHKYEVKGWYADGSVVKKAPTVLKEFAAGLALNPTGLVDALPKDRVKFLQSAMPLVFTAAEVAAASGDHPASLDQTMSLDRFIAYRDGKYDKRRDTGVVMRDKQGSRKQWAVGLPDDDPLKLSSSRSAASAWQSKTGEEIALLKANLETARQSLTAAQEEWRRSYAGLSDEIDDAEAKEIEAIRAEAERKITEVRNTKDKDRKALLGKYEELIADGRKPFEADIERIAGELAAAEQRLASEIQTKTIRDSIIKLDAEISDLQDTYNRLDDAVKALDDLKKAKLDALPIPGVEVRDGEIYYNGLSFDRQLNTAMKYLLSFQVAALTLGDFPFMIFDGAEALDDENRQAFIDGIKQAGFQVVMAEVGEAPALEVQVA